jgi:hypothetical protein
MPCYRIETVSISFKVENLVLLARALEKGNWDINFQNETGIAIQKKIGNSYNRITISFRENKIISQSLNEKQLTDVSNSIKKAYSLEVINEVAKKNKWQTRKMGEDQYQLVRY